MESAMTPPDRDAIDHFDAELDAIARGAAFQPDPANASLIAGARRLRAVDHAVHGPQPGLSDQIWDALMNETGLDEAPALPSASATGGPALNGHSAPRPWRAKAATPPIVIRRWRLTQLAAAAVLVLTIAASIVVLRVVAPEQTMTLMTAPGASTIETLLDAPVESRAPERTPLSVERWRFRPAPATLHIPSLDGPQWIAMEAGQLVATVAGTERRLATGEGLVVEAGKELVLSNSSQETAAVLRGVAAVEFSLEDYDRDLVTSEIALDTDAHETLPPGISRVVFEQMMLPPGSTLRIDPASGQDWVSVVSGTLGLTLTGDGLPRGWQSGQEREVSATDHVPALARGIQVTLHNVGDDPLILLRLRVMPVAEADSAP
jgi:hypothetical protein